MVKLGDKVKDRVTGFKGIAVAKTEWLYGCVRIGVRSQKLNKDGSPITEQWFDEASVTVTSKAPGGPVRPTAPSRDPIR